MKQLEIVIRNPTGLHARPAKIFVNLAKKFKSDIRVQHGGKKANAKSMLSMLTLGVEVGGTINIIVDGIDEEQALDALATAVASGLGEGEMIPVESTDPPKETMPKAQPTTAVASANNIINGIAAAPGIAIGPVVQIRREALTVEETFTSSSDEKDRLQKAIEQARQQLTSLRDQMLAGTAAGEAEIFDVHLELIEDPELLEKVQARIAQRQNAAKAWQATIQEQANVMAGLSDPLLAARAADLHDVGYRILSLLVGADSTSKIPLPDHPVIIIAHDLSPSDTASLDKEKVLGFCTAAGGPTAHSAILARALNLPAVVSAGDGVLDISNDTMIILNGDNGRLTLSPDSTAIAQAKASQQQRQEQLLAAQQTADEPAITSDGHRVEIAANIGGVAEAQQAFASGAEGVGLLRTEFLFLDRTEAPTEQEQFQVYRDIALAMQGQPVIIRTLDIGGDKPLPYIDVPTEANPFLGERGIRLCLNRPELLRQQLRAVLRAAEFGPLRIMFPMVANVSEWRTARAMVEEIRAALKAPQVELGIMIEIPSAALLADAFAAEVDFFSVGTNDLTQYTLAMDRMHPLLASQTDGLHPAVLRLIAGTVEAAHKAGKWVGVCGELGADPQAIPILLGLGVDELSVSGPAIATVKAQVRSLNWNDTKALAQRALASATAAEVRALV